MSITFIVFGLFLETSTDEIGSLFSKGANNHVSLQCVLIDLHGILAGAKVTSDVDVVLSPFH